MQKEIEKLLSEKISQILQHLEEDLEHTIEVLEKEEDREYAIVKANILGEDLSLLIGYHGKNMHAIQSWLNALVDRYLAAADKETGQFRVLVDIGGYREEQDQKTIRRAHEAMEQVKFLQEEFALPPMPPRHRRLIHMEVAKDNSLESHSEGEGRDRHVVISYQQ